MRIVITGGSGFIGRNIKEYFESKGADVYAPTSAELNLLEPIGEEQDGELCGAPGQIDAVIHCAIAGGRRISKDDPSVIYKNVAMHNSLARWFEIGASARFFFNIGSGAEQNRGVGVSNIIYPKDIPEDYYGLSKRIIFDNQSGRPGFVNLRAFGVFGNHEEQQRFIYSAIHSYKHKLPIVIHKNRRMDFFFVEDIARVIESIVEIHTPTSRHDVNLSYPDRLLYLTDIATFVNSLDSHTVPVVVEEPALDRDYYGNSVMLTSLMRNTENSRESATLELVGLEEGIRRMYEQL